MSLPFPTACPCRLCEFLLYMACFPLAWFSMTLCALVSAAQSTSSNTMVVITSDLG